MLEKVKGNIWEFTGKLETIKTFEKERTQIKIISRKIFGNQCTIRYLSDLSTNNLGITVEPGLEDAYIALTQQKYL